jgi:alanine dehydrogenase
VLLGGVPGVAAANVMIIGGGSVGSSAASVAIGMGADVFIFDVSVDRLRELEAVFGGRCSTVYSSTLAIEEMLPAHRPGDRRRARGRRPRAVRDPQRISWR